jgi:hypothetical protein
MSQPSTLGDSFRGAPAWLPRSFSPQKAALGCSRPSGRSSLAAPRWTRDSRQIRAPPPFIGNGPPRHLPDLGSGRACCPGAIYRRSGLPSRGHAHATASAESGRQSGRPLRLLRGRRLHDEGDPRAFLRHHRIQAARHLLPPRPALLERVGLACPKCPFGGDSSGLPARARPDAALWTPLQAQGMPRQGAPAPRRTVPLLARGSPSRSEVPAQSCARAAKRCWRADRCRRGSPARQTGAKSH